MKIILSLTALLIVAFIIIFSHRDIPLDDLKIKYANSNSSFVAVNKMDVHFRDEGVQTDTIPIVLIHGTGASLHTFNSWSDRLKKSNRIIRVDLPAYGLTGPFPDENYTMANYTAFLKDFLIALNIKQCVLAGNSLGGAIAWNFTLEQPSMVTKLILINASGYPIASKSVPIAFSLAKIPVINKLLTFITPRFLVRSSVENVYFDNSKVTDLVVERYFNLTLRAGNRKAFVDRLKIPKDTSTHKNIKNIQQPTLILWGAEDLLIPVENAYKFQEDLPNNTLVILENTGHTPMEESPLESLAPVISFLKTAP
ncbi:alpha/beta hydrolase [Flavobacteriaceae bacterium]|nr:alpha/beta hydrolase [Flavobacteriaceae bacterium]